MVENLRYSIHATGKYKIFFFHNLLIFITLLSSICFIFFQSSSIKAYFQANIVWIWLDFNINRKVLYIEKQKEIPELKKMCTTFYFRRTSVTCSHHFMSLGVNQVTLEIKQSSNFAVNGCSVILINISQNKKYFKVL